MTMISVRGWEMEELIHLIEFWDTPVAEQAAELGRSVGSVQSRRQRIRKDHGLVLTPSRAAKRAYLTDYEQTLAFHEVGHAWAEVATGGEFTEIWISPYGDSDQAGKVVPASQVQTRARADVTCFSGLVAEAIHLDLTHPDLTYQDLLHASIQHSRDGDLDGRGNVRFLTDREEMKRLRDAITNDWPVLQALVDALGAQPIIDLRQSMTFEEAMPHLRNVTPYRLHEHPEPARPPETLTSMTPRKPDTRKGDRSATRTRPVRVSDELWEAAKTEADNRGENLSTAIRRFLVDYVGDPGIAALSASEADRVSTRANAARVKGAE